MREMFDGYYRPREVELRELWREATFVFDTNVLLNLYRYPVASRNDWLRVLSDNASRIWIPHQVALEFQENRPSVLADQVKRYDDVEAILSEIEASLDKLGDLRLTKKHSVINPESLRTSVKEAVDRFSSELERLRLAQPDAHSDDEVRHRIDEILAGRIGPAPDQDWLDEVYAEGDARFQRKQPPGYIDANRKDKNRDYTYRGLYIRRKYGDLILWKELLREAENSETFQQLIFITDDSKEDWWWIVGGKTIGPRPELIEEIKQAKVQLFYMYSPERFLKYANQYLDARIGEDSLAQVRDVSAETRARDVPLFRQERSLAIEAVGRWLRDRWPTAFMRRNVNGHTFYIRPDMQLPGIGVDVIYQRDPLLDRSRLDGLIRRAEREVQAGPLQGVLLVYVGADLEVASTLAALLNQQGVRKPGIRVMAGALQPDADGFAFLPTIEFEQGLLWATT